VSDDDVMIIASTCT